MATSSPVCNPSALKPAQHAHGESFAATFWPVGRALGLSKLGCRMVELAPGKKAFPYHLHHANEEMFVILEGRGTLRFDGREYPVTAGDVVGAGTGPATAHQIVNTSDAVLRYLAISTMLEPDIGEYPDSGKLIAMAGAPPGGDKARRTVELMFQTATAVDYWRDER